MPKKFVLVGPLVCALWFASMAGAQALPTATRPGGLQAGFGVAYAHPDYGQFSIEGVSAWVDFDFAYHLGVEGAVHYIALNTPTDLAENTYVVGPRYFHRFGRFVPYGKVVAGLGSLVIQETQDNPGKYSGNYFMYGLGGGVDIDISHRFSVRAIDVQYQRWPNLGNGLTPLVVNIGASYRFR